MGIRERLANVQAKVLHALEHKARCVGGTLGLDVSEVRTGYVVDDERGPKVFFHAADLDVVHIDALYVTNVEAVGGHGAETVGIWIDVLEFSRLDLCIFPGSTPLVKDKHVAESYVLNEMTGDAGYEASLA